MTTTLFYNPGKEKPMARKGSISFNGVHLEPGVNTIDSEQFKVLSSHPDYQKYVDWGAIATSPEPLPLFMQPPATDLSDFVPKPKATETTTAKPPRKKPSPQPEVMPANE